MLQVGVLALLEFITTIASSREHENKVVHIVHAIGGGTDTLGFTTPIAPSREHENKRIIITYATGGGTGTARSHNPKSAI